MRTRHQNWPNGERGAENDASMSEFRARRPKSYQRNCDGTATLTWSLAYVETDPAEADAGIIVENLLHGQYEQSHFEFSRSMRMKAGRETSQRQSPPRSAMLPSTKAES